MAVAFPFSYGKQKSGGREEGAKGTFRYGNRHKKEKILGPII